ncbi:hypothetical protein BC830DRAFT_1103309 [Chytriomyces sp. MP71]|nr:hypothetical protein BC830DRAFT_1103309 [Chytriomyces sp. MP71]
MPETFFERHARGLAIRGERLQTGEAVWTFLKRDVGCSRASRVHNHAFGEKEWTAMSGAAKTDANRRFKTMRFRCNCEPSAPVFVFAKFSFAKNEYELANASPNQSAPHKRVRVRNARTSDDDTLVGSGSASGTSGDERSPTRISDSPLSEVTPFEFGAASPSIALVDSTSVSCAKSMDQHYSVDSCCSDCGMQVGAQFAKAHFLSCAANARTFVPKYPIAVTHATEATTCGVVVNAFTTVAAIRSTLPWSDRLIGDLYFVGQGDGSLRHKLEDKEILNRYVIGFDSLLVFEPAPEMDEPEEETESKLVEVEEEGTPDLSSLRSNSTASLSSSSSSTAMDLDEQALFDTFFDFTALAASSDGTLEVPETAQEYVVFPRISLLCRLIPFSPRLEANEIIVTRAVSVVYETGPAPVNAVVAVESNLLEQSDVQCFGRQLESEPLKFEKGSGQLIISEQLQLNKRGGDSMEVTDVQPQQLDSMGVTDAQPQHLDACVGFLGDGLALHLQRLEGGDSADLTQQHGVLSKLDAELVCGSSVPHSPGPSSQSGRSLQSQQFNRGDGFSTCDPDLSLLHQPGTQTLLAPHRQALPSVGGVAVDRLLERAVSVHSEKGTSALPNILHHNGGTVVQHELGNHIQHDHTGFGLQYLALVTNRTEAKKHEFHQLQDVRHQHVASLHSLQSQTYDDSQEGCDGCMQPQTLAIHHLKLQQQGALGHNSHFNNRQMAVMESIVVRHIQQQRLGRDDSQHFDAVAPDELHCLLQPVCPENEPDDDLDSYAADGEDSDDEASDFGTRKSLAQWIGIADKQENNDVDFQKEGISEPSTTHHLTKGQKRGDIGHESLHLQNETTDAEAIELSAALNNISLQENQKNNRYALLIELNQAVNTRIDAAQARNERVTDERNHCHFAQRELLEFHSDSTLYREGGSEAAEYVLAAMSQTKSWHDDLVRPTGLLLLFDVLGLLQSLQLAFINILGWNPQSLCSSEVQEITACLDQALMLPANDAESYVLGVEQLAHLETRTRRYHSIYNMAQHARDDTTAQEHEYVPSQVIALNVNDYMLGIPTFEQLRFVRLPTNTSELSENPWNHHCTVRTNMQITADDPCHQRCIARTNMQRAARSRPVPYKAPQSFLRLFDNDHFYEFILHDQWMVTIRQNLPSASKRLQTNAPDANLPYCTRFSARTDEPDQAVIRRAQQLAQEAFCLADKLILEELMEFEPYSQSRQLSSPETEIRNTAATTGISRQELLSLLSGDDFEKNCSEVDVRGSRHQLLQNIRFQLLELAKCHTCVDSWLQEQQVASRFAGSENDDVLLFSHSSATGLLSPDIPSASTVTRVGYTD